VAGKTTEIASHGFARVKFVHGSCWFGSPWVSFNPSGFHLTSVGSYSVWLQSNGGWMQVTQTLFSKFEKKCNLVFKYWSDWVQQGFPSDLNEL